MKPFPLLINPLLPADETVEAQETSVTPLDLGVDYSLFTRPGGISWETESVSMPSPAFEPRPSVPVRLGEQIANVLHLKAKNAKPPTPYEVAQSVATMLNYVSQPGGNYVYNPSRGIFEKISMDDLVGLVYETARTAIELDGKPSFAREVARCLIDDARFRVNPGFFASDFVAFGNYSVNTRQKSTKSHSPEFRATRAIKANWAPGAAHPTFDTYLSFVSGGDKTLESRIWQILGYMLVPDNSAKNVFLFEGEPSTGKSLLVNLLRALISTREDTCISLAVNELAERFSLASLADAALCIAPDMPAKPLSKRAIGVLKAISGGDAVSGDQKYKNRRHFFFPGKVLLVSNHELSLEEADPAFEDRLIRVPFLNSVPRSEQNRDLLLQLLMEADGIATTAIFSYWDLVAHGYKFAGNFERACFAESAEDRELEWLIAEYVRGHLVEMPDAVLFLKMLWEAWKEATHIELPLPAFCRILYRVFPTLTKNHKRPRPTPGSNPQAAIIGYALI